MALVKTSEFSHNLYIFSEKRINIMRRLLAIHVMTFFFFISVYTLIYQHLRTLMFLKVIKNYNLEVKLFNERQRIIVVLIFVIVLKSNPAHHVGIQYSRLLRELIICKL